MKKITLEKNEEVVVIIKISLFKYFWEILGAILFILVPSYFAFWLFNQGRYGVAAFCFSLSVGFLLLLKIVIGRMRNKTVLTNQRLTHFESSGFFDEEILSVNLYEIQNVFYFKKGLLAKLFNYGDLSLENSQRQELLRLKNISSPEKVFLSVNKLKNDFWMKEKDLDTEEIIDMFINNLALIETEDLREIKECVEDVLRNRSSKK